MLSKAALSATFFSFLVSANLHQTTGNIPRTARYDKRWAEPEPYYLDDDFLDIYARDPIKTPDLGNQAWAPGTGSGSYAAKHARRWAQPEAESEADYSVNDVLEIYAREAGGVPVKSGPGAVPPQPPSPMQQSLGKTQSPNTQMAGQLSSTAMNKLPDTINSGANFLNAIKGLKQKRNAYASLDDMGADFDTLYARQALELEMARREAEHDALHRRSAEALAEAMAEADADADAEAWYDELHAREADPELFSDGYDH